MIKSQREAITRATGLRRFLLERFAEQNESPRDFVNNSDYSRNAVEMVVAGQYVSARIRRDMARYLGRDSWNSLMGEYKKALTRGAPDGTA